MEKSARRKVKPESTLGVPWEGFFNVRESTLDFVYYSPRIFPFHTFLSNFLFLGPDL